MRHKYLCFTQSKKPKSTNMKRITFLIFFTILSVNLIQAQCPGCITDTTCPILQPDGGVCPDTLPPATVGQYYDTDVTFYMPDSTVYQGLNVNILEIEIIGAQGIPANLMWECDSAANGCVYHPPSNTPASNFGCVKICGTPIVAPGMYTILVNILADAFVPSIGATITDQPENYVLYLEVLPGQGSNNSFTFTPNSGCEPLSVDFDGIIDFNPDQPTTYQWDFDNGNTSTQKSVNQVFSAGNYEVNLVTTVYNYTMTQICISALNNDWCGDVDEVQCNCGVPVIGQCPDPYIIISDANSNPVYQSPDEGGVTNHCWDSISVILDNPPYTLTVWDSDAISADDLLGTFALNISATGQMSFASQDGTIGDFMIDTTVSSIFDDLDTINVNPLPTAPLISYNNSGTVSIDNPDATATYQWYYNGALLTGETANTVDATVYGSGDYSVEITDINGCVNLSTPLMVVLASVDKAEDLGWAIYNIFPNPTQSYVTVNMELDQAEDLTFNVHDALGRTVWSDTRNLQAGKQLERLDLSSLNVGFYLIEIQSDKGNWTNKLFVQ